MADFTPFLSQSHSTEPETPTLHKHQFYSLDDTIERCIGGDFGCVQFLQVLLVSLAWVFDAQQLFISVFADAQPTWHCTNQLACNYTTTNICELPKNSWAWDLSPHTSIISEWSLECAGSFITGLPATSFFLGCMSGGLLLATLADSSLGRKNMLLLSCSLMSVAGLLTVILSTSVWIYSAFKFVSGFGRATVGTCSLVLSMELVGKKWRGEVGIIGFLCSTLGFLSLPLIAYLNRTSSWRILYLWTCIPTIIYCTSVYFFVPESPRWLFVRGRKEEFMATLKHIAQYNSSNLTRWSFSGMSIEHEPGNNTDLYSAVNIMLEKRWAIRRLLTLMVVGFGVGMVYYGLPLGVGNLGFNLYLAVTFNALSEVPASLISFFLARRLNRKSAVLGFTMVSGVCCVMCVVLVRDELQMLAEMASFFSACTAFNMLLIYTMELFPTCVRNSAVSMVRQALVFGGVFSPLLDGKASYGAFGVTTGCCGLFVACLPETRGGILCDTMDEEEQKERAAVAAASYLQSHA
ncbi:organic cation/carnitine transporter 3-like [Cornus florida]|uniref:organic cation/carnitine transporter 3-like n=1 Tax=Cornus florida TaxID=4283 RepID=UPI0028963553|nr:organic cation/carnitine transporter 3-like [Cornus florida]